MLTVICPDCNAIAQRFKEPYIVLGMRYDGTVYRYVCPRCGRAGGVGFEGKVANGKRVSKEKAILIAADKFLNKEKYEAKHRADFAQWKKAQEAADKEKAHAQEGKEG